MICQKMPAWPAHIPYVLKPMGRVQMPKLSQYDMMDLVALEQAAKRQRRDAAIQCSFETGTMREVLFRNHGDFTAVASSAVEASLLAGQNDQPALSPLYFMKSPFRVISILARGVLSNTGTPTLIFQGRLGSTAGSADLTGASCGVSAAITTISGVTNQFWEARLDLVCTTAGIGTGNTTLAGAGYVMSGGGFATPFIYALEPTTPPTGTWTLTANGALAYYFNLSVTWSANSASNTITCKQLLMYGEN